MRFLSFVFLAGRSAATVLGFDYASISGRDHLLQADFEAQFRTAKGLSYGGTGGFTSARLYTTIVRWPYFMCSN